MNGAALQHNVDTSVSGGMVISIRPAARCEPFEGKGSCWPQHLE